MLISSMWLGAGEPCWRKRAQWVAYRNNDHYRKPQTLNYTFRKLGCVVQVMPCLCFTGNVFSPLKVNRVMAYLVQPNGVLELMKMALCECNLYPWEPLISLLLLTYPMAYQEAGQLFNAWNDNSWWIWELKKEKEFWWRWQSEFILW